MTYSQRSKSSTFLVTYSSPLSKPSTCQHTSLFSVKPRYLSGTLLFFRQCQYLPSTQFISLWKSLVPVWHYFLFMSKLGAANLHFFTFHVYVVSMPGTANPHFLLFLSMLCLSWRPLTHIYLLFLSMSCQSQGPPTHTFYFFLSMLCLSRRSPTCAFLLLLSMSCLSRGPLPRTFILFLSMSCQSLWITVVIILSL